MEIVKTKKLLNAQFYGNVHEKKQIFLHHTAGTTADGAINWWNQTPEPVGTAYLIDRDGSIIEVFSPQCWAFHLGVTTKAGGDPNNLDEKQSIGIELVAAGPVYADETGKFVHYPLYPNKAAKNAIKQDEVWDMGEKGWRGARYYHTYTDKQIESMIWLVNKLCTDFKINLQPNVLSMFEYNEQVVKDKTPGLWSHSTVRKDKQDIVPHPSLIEKLLKGFPKNVGAGENKAIFSPKVEKVIPPTPPKTKSK